MRKIDPGYQGFLKLFRDRFCFTPYGIVHHCEFRVPRRKCGPEYSYMAECPYRKGCMCNSPEHPLNKPLEDFVMEAL